MPMHYRLLMQTCADGICFLTQPNHFLNCYVEIHSLRNNYLVIKKRGSFSTPGQLSLKPKTSITSKINNYDSLLSKLYELKESLI